MSKRLQVILDDGAMRELWRAARRRGTTVADWVRQALRLAHRQESTGDPKRKIDAIRRAAQHSFPTGAVGEMLGAPTA